MKSLKVMVDIDGVLADFNTPFRDLLKGITGGKEPEVWPPKEWHWAKRYCSSAEISKAWEHVDTSHGLWWEKLPALDTWAVRDIDRLQAEGDVYFVTARFGPGVKVSTENWFFERRVEAPTVLIGATPEGKALVVKALDLNVVIDDRPENLEAIWALNGAFRADGEDRRYFLLSQSWNVKAEFTPQLAERVERVFTLGEIVKRCGL